MAPESERAACDWPVERCPRPAKYPEMNGTYCRLHQSIVRRFRIEQEDKYDMEFCCFTPQGDIGKSPERDSLHMEASMNRLQEKRHGRSED